MGKFLRFLWLFPLVLVAVAIGLTIVGGLLRGIWKGLTTPRRYR